MIKNYINPTDLSAHSDNHVIDSNFSNNISAGISNKRTTVSRSYRPCLKSSFNNRLKEYNTGRGLKSHVLSQEFNITQYKNNRVKFLSPEISEYIDSIWEHEEELREYRDNLNIQFPNPPKREIERRSNLVHITKASQRNAAEKYYNFFKQNPLGVCNTPRHRDITESEKCLQYRLLLVKSKVAKELTWAPVIFANIHPFDTNLVFYFNSCIGRTKQDPPQPYIKRVRGSTIERYVFQPEIHIPLELERSLWHYRKAMFRQWYMKFLKDSLHWILKIDFTSICTQLECLQQVDNPVKYVDNPMEHFAHISRT